MSAVRPTAILSSLLALMLFQAVPAAAQDWSPFRQWQEEKEPKRPPERVRGGSRTSEPLPDLPDQQPETRPEPEARFPARRSGSVERTSLDPVMAGDDSGLPHDLWRGVDLTTFEELLARLELPPRSPIVHQLWRRMLMSPGSAPSGAPSPDHFVALRLEALYRSGLLAEMAQIIDGSDASSPLVMALSARKDIGLGQKDAGCRTVASLARASGELAGRLKGEAQLLMGYCAAVAGDTQGADLAATLAHQEGVEAGLPLSVLGGFAAGNKPQIGLPKRVLLLDYRFLELLGPVNGAQIFDKAEPALLAALAGDTNTEARLRIAAAEAALRLNALTPEAVADIYRRHQFAQQELSDPQAARSDPLLRRALLFRGVELSRSPAQQARMARALLDDARRSLASLQTARMLAPLLDNVGTSPDADSLGEIAVEIALAAGRIEDAQRWARTAGTGQHWLSLVEIVDPARRGGRLQALRPMEDLAERGRLNPEALHRLATVLDALDIDVPIPLWDAASRTPQPAGGYLPETGVLADLAQSAKRGEAGRTILLAMRTLGPDGPNGANILALGDSIRALKQIGLEADARRIALEALLPVWPRMAFN